MEEYIGFKEKDIRHLPQQLDHDPEVILYANDDAKWFYLPARKVELSYSSGIYSIPLFGHTAKHSGVAFRDFKAKKWIF